MSGRGGRLHRGNLQTPQVAGEDAARLLKTHDPEARRPEARVPKTHDPEARRLEAHDPEDPQTKQTRIINKANTTKSATIMLYRRIPHEVPLFLHFWSTDT